MLSLVIESQNNVEWTNYWWGFAVVMTELPQARKASLARFLEKRKDRWQQVQAPLWISKVWECFVASWSLRCTCNVDVAGHEQKDHIHQKLMDPPPRHEKSLQPHLAASHSPDHHLQHWPQGCRSSTCSLLT
jgi:hypothetical protein